MPEAMAPRVVQAAKFLQTTKVWIGAALIGAGVMAAEWVELGPTLDLAIAADEKARVGTWAAAILGVVLWIPSSRAWARPLATPIAGFGLAYVGTGLLLVIVLRPILLPLAMVILLPMMAFLIPAEALRHDAKDALLILGPGAGVLILDWLPWFWLADAQTWLTLIVVAVAYGLTGGFVIRSVFRERVTDPLAAQ